MSAAGESQKVAANRRALAKRFSITDPLHVAYLLETLPCGIETVQEAWNDRTRADVNAARALLAEGWQATVRAFHTVEKRRTESAAKVQS